MTPRSCLRWKRTGRIFKTIGLKWVPTRKIFAFSTNKVDSEPTNSSNDDITNQYECKQTLDVSAGDIKGWDGDASFQLKSDSFTTSHANLQKIKLRGRLLASFQDDAMGFEPCWSRHHKWILGSTVGMRDDNWYGITVITGHALSKGHGNRKIQLHDGSSFILEDVRIRKVSSVWATRFSTTKVLGVEGAQGDREAEVFQSSMSKVYWAKDTTSIKQRIFKPVKSSDYSGITKSIVDKYAFGGTGSMQVLHGFKFEVKPPGDHTFEVEPQENVDQGTSLQEVQTQDLMDYQLASDREQHLACELFGYRDDSNVAAFAIAAVEKIYAHESLTFNNTVACEVISKWKAGLKDDMDAQSDVYVLSNGCRKCSDDNDGYYWEYTLGMFMHLFLYIDDMVFLADARLRFGLPRVCWIKQKEMYLGHFILSLEGSLSGDCDVEKNDVGMLDKFDRGLQTSIHCFVDFELYRKTQSLSWGILKTFTEVLDEGNMAKGI
ncbi:hypothetical protein Tco_0531412 [Tanacetum coccineum]